MTSCLDFHHQVYILFPLGGRLDIGVHLTFLASLEGLKDPRGRHAVVGNGYLPERVIQTGIGPGSVKVPKVRDRSERGNQFHSQLLPPYLRRTKSLEELIPWLYLKGIPTGDFQEPSPHC